LVSNVKLWIRIRKKLIGIHNTGENSLESGPIVERGLDIFTKEEESLRYLAVLRIRIQIHRIHMFLGLLDPDPDPLVRGMEPDPSILKQKM
jgi:hypothetical protein